MNRQRNWGLFLVQLHEDMTSRGYTKYNQKLHGESFSYFKTFYGKYQIGVLVYDWREYPAAYAREKQVSFQYECMPVDLNGRVDLSVCNDTITLEEFEEMSEHFYVSMKKYMKDEE